MRKGQFFIISAVVVCVLVAAIANNYYYQETGVKAEYERASSLHAVIENIKTELTITTIMDPSDDDRIASVKEYMENETARNNYDIEIP